MKTVSIAGIDVFCGAGGLTYGLRQAGIDIVAGIDIDPACEYPFEANNSAAFIDVDVRLLPGEALLPLYPKGAVRLLAGCAPCRPFSPFQRGAHTTRHRDWSLLSEFSRLVDEVRPELVTMENVPDLASQGIFGRFVKMLERLRYHVDHRSVYCPRFGVPQERRRLVLVASRIGPVTVPKGTLPAERFRTVRDAIGSLPTVAAGASDPSDSLHRARRASEINLQRLKASRPGGTWRDWPEDLRAVCHRSKRGASYQSVYARMRWDHPAPTVTTLAYSFGSGRFGHPEQDRSITLREAAILQSFPRTYRFVPQNETVFFARVGRLIGNAVPPKLGRAIGHELMRAAAAAGTG